MRNIDNLQICTYAQIYQGLVQRSHRASVSPTLYQVTVFGGCGDHKKIGRQDYLKELEAIGVLSIHKVRRENIYLNTKLYEILSK